MSNNSVMTHDNAESAMSQFIKTIGFTHEGAAGSTSLSFGSAAATHQDAQSSSTAATTSDVGGGAMDSASGGSTAPATTGSGSEGGAGQNAVLTHDDASSYTTSLAKMLTFTHEGAAGSTSLSYGSAQQTHYDAQSSDTSALFGDGAFGGWGSGSGQNDATASSGQGSDGGSGGGNAFVTSDHAVNFDSEMLKAFSFSHDGAAGSTSIGYETAAATHWDSQSSSTSAMFDDLFGQGAFGGMSDGSHSLIG